jgi:hypothetical protein
LQTLDYDKIPLQKVQFLLIAFDDDVLFELSPILSTDQNPSEMQGMDKKYDGHAWNKLVITNIKKLFGLNFRKACYLGHLQYVQDVCENFVCSASCNETFRCGECVHIPVLGQINDNDSIYFFA